MQFLLWKKFLNNIKKSNELNDAFASIEAKMLDELG